MAEKVSCAAGTVPHNSINTNRAFLFLRMSLSFRNKTSMGWNLHGWTLCPSWKPPYVPDAPWLRLHAEPPPRTDERQRRCCETGLDSSNHPDLTVRCNVDCHWPAHPRDSQQRSWRDRLNSGRPASMRRNISFPSGQPRFQHRTEPYCPCSGRPCVGMTWPMTFWAYRASSSSLTGARKPDRREFGRAGTRSDVR
jgi:hypothetical protein